MNLVRAAMRHPVTVMVAILAVGLGAALALMALHVDILPSLGIPVIYVAQPYGGMDPAQMEGYLTFYYEYHFLYITGIEHVESKSIQGVSLIKLQFHPGMDMAQAMAETITMVNRARAFMPPGTVPPFVMRFDTGSVPVGNLVFTSSDPSRTIGQIQDQALNRVRPLFATLPGVSAPPPFGASQRTVVIRLDPERLQAFGMSPEEIVAAIGQANAISPSGNVRLGDRMPMVPLNSVVRQIHDLDTLPLRTGSTRTVLLRDVGTVEDGTDIPTGFALVNGRRTVYIPVTRRADASTLAVVNLVKANLPRFQAVLSDDVRVSYEFDQSPVVTRAIGGLLMEGLLGAVLTGVMVFLFLRDGRSAVLVVLNIPLSLLAAVLGLWLAGQTLNLMTLGGLALAVGILVDEATVAVENIQAHRARGASAARAALAATAETAVPRFLAMLCILAVFLPSFFMTGTVRALFVPLSLAVGFSMVASFLLSSTFVPVLSAWQGRSPAPGGAIPGPGAPPGSPGLFASVRDRYARVERAVVGHGWVATAAYAAASAAGILVFGSLLGSEIFPAVDAGQFQLRLRAPAGTHFERTEKIYLDALDAIRGEVGTDGVALSLGFVGIQPSSYPINTIHLWTGGPEEAVLQVQLKAGTPVRVEDLKERLRRALSARMPDVRVSFEPSDIVSRVMSLGSPTPVNVVVSGPDLAADRAHAERLYAALSRVPSLRDLQFAQSLDYPTMEVTADRERAGVMGFTMGDLARALVPATSSSRFTAPNYWADPASGIAYQLQVEVPPERIHSAEDVENIPVARRGGDPALLRNVARVTAGRTVGEYDRYNMQRMVTLTANVAGEDLGRVGERVDGAIREAGDPPPRVFVAVRGQLAAMRELFGGLRSGLILTVVLIGLLLAAYFQSGRLALAVISTVPAALLGTTAALWLTGTTLNVQSFMGGIMAVGIAVANAILLVTFAERARSGGATSAEAALEGARGRLRPIFMTSVTMIAGMIPMALGLGEGGEQSAPLGRAVIGGLAAATVGTLFVLPAVFAILQGRRPARSPSLDPDDRTSSRFEPTSSTSS